MDKRARQQINEDNDDEHHSDEGTKQGSNQARNKRVRLDNAIGDIFIGHQADDPEIEVFGKAITSLTEPLQCWAHGKHGSYKIGMAKVNFTQEVLGTRPQEFWVSHQLREHLKDYLRSKPGGLAKNSAQPSSAAQTSKPAPAKNLPRATTLSRRLESKTSPPSTSSTDTLAKLTQAAHDVQGEFDTMSATITNQEDIIRDQRQTLTNQEDTIRDQQQTIRDLSSQLASSTTQTPTPGPPQGQTQTSSGKYVIGDKIYAQMPAGSANEGVYVEKEGKYKNGFLEKDVLSEYKRYKVAGISEESVKIKDIDFHKMINGDLLQKQEELVEIEGKTYVRRKLHVAYSSDEE